MDKQLPDFKKVSDIEAYYISKLTYETAFKLTSAHNEYTKAQFVLSEKKAALEKVREEALAELEGLGIDYRKRVGG